MERNTNLTCWLIYMTWVFLFIAVLLMPLKIALSSQQPDSEVLLSNALESNNIFRIHVIANSNTAYDQYVKRRVRDAIMTCFNDNIYVSDLESAKNLQKQINQNISLFQTVAVSAANANSFYDKITVECGMLHLSQKRYGNIVLPEDEYLSLKITLGSGNGENWWCILYPDLCFALSSIDTSNASLFFNTKGIFKNWLFLAN